MSLLEAAPEQQAGPEGSIFLPEQQENIDQQPSLEDLIEAFFDPDWERAETVLIAIATLYPDQMNRTCDKLQYMLFLERGPFAKDTSEGLVRLEIMQYWYELLQAYKGGAQNIAS